MVDFIKKKIRAARDLMSPGPSGGPQITDEAHVQAGRQPKSCNPDFLGTDVKPWRTIKGAPVFQITLDIWKAHAKI